MDYAQLNALCSNNPQPNADGEGSIAGAGSDLSNDPVFTNPIFKKNLEYLAIHNPLAAREIAQVLVGDGVRFIDTDEGIPSVELGGIAMASKRRPMGEARKIAERLDPAKVACCAVLGFGIGYHCGALLERLGTCGVVVCFEPDIGLLRAVLERVDYSAMFGTGRFFLTTSPDDPATLSQMFQGIEAVVGLGVEIVSHPPSASRLGDGGARFGKIFSDVLKATRTHVITTLANSQVSFRNAMMNLDHYTTSAGVDSLKDACKGKPAVVVSAGPSLERNIELLADPQVRDSVVIIAVQTVLKQMIARGIKPHFVAALDYHEISKRFYEGLSAADVEGIRLVVEPKANPAILEAFPGEVLCVSDDLLNTLLGDELTRDMGEIPMGGTVAHLCYYIARHLGCEPVIFIGQDLGFTDGQYYSAGAAIHQIWSGELNAHNTLEMMEWQRVARMRGLLRKKTDIHGRAIYADEQMSTYLAQFESEFQKDAEKGLTVIDATEGGVLKKHTTVMTLKEAIERYALGGRCEIPSTIELRNENPDRQRQIHKRLDSIIGDCERIAYLSEQSVGLLRSMIEHQEDQRKVNGLITQVQAVRDKVVGFKVAFKISESVNQIGVLNRMKRDRAIEMDRDASAIDRQRFQIQRDIANVEWTRDAARSVVNQLGRARDAYLGLESKQTNELGEAAQDGIKPESGTESSNHVHRQSRVHAVVIADPEFGGLGTRRELKAQIAGGLNMLQLTVARLAQARELDGITILTPDPGAIERILGSFLADISAKTPIVIAGVDPHRFRGRASRIGSARVQSSECWRGSIGMLSVYDEQFDPGLVASVMHKHEIDACAVVGGDWVMVDPDLVDETVSRYRRQDSEKRIAFSQAVPGMGTMVVDRVTIDSLADAIEKSGSGWNHFATLGALVGYIPTTPQFDPIAKGMCVEISPTIRDAGLRMIADTPARIAAMRDAYQALSADSTVIDVDAVRCVEAYHDATKRYSRVCPRTIVLESCTGRLAGGDWGIWKRNSIEPIERPVLTISDAHKLFNSVRGLRDDVALVFDGVGDPLMHQEAMSFVQLAKEDGIESVEFRTDLLREGVDAKEMLDSGIDILSVDVLAESRETYAALTGQDRLDEVYARLQTLFDAMHSDGAHGVWFVPRMTRCDAVYGELEQFYDKWLMLCGSVVLDPLPQLISNQRIQRLPIPSVRQRQLDRSTMYVRCDGSVVDRIGRTLGGQGRPINAFEEGIEQAYQRMCSAMRSSRIEPKPGIGSMIEEHAA